MKDEEKYYFLLDEVQLLDEFVSVLNGLADKKNCDVFVTGSNAKFLSRDIATEFGGRGDEVHMYPLSFSEFMTVYYSTIYEYTQYRKYKFAQKIKPGKAFSNFGCQTSDFISKKSEGCSIKHKKKTVKCKKAHRKICYNLTKLYGKEKKDEVY